MPEDKEVELDANQIKQEFAAFLKEKYGVDGVEIEEAPDEEELRAEAEERYLKEEKAALKKARQPIKRLSEKMNEVNWYIPSYDLSLLKPGDIVYTTEKVPGNAGVPWEIRRPKLCIISAVRGKGADATFYTYNYRVVNEPSYAAGKDFSIKIVSEEDSIDHPLTKLQAQTMCAKFNFLSKQTYEERMKKIQKTKNKKPVSKKNLAVMKASQNEK